MSKLVRIQPFECLSNHIFQHFFVSNNMIEKPHSFQKKIVISLH
jgi:hypothetical protein